MTVRPIAATLVGILLLVMLAACGGSGQPAGSTKVTMTEYKFDPSPLTAKAGKVDFYLVNAGTVAHDVLIVASSGKIISKSALVSAGDSFDFSVSNLPAGSYQVYCDVPGHKESGMVATLEVT
ncbi:MAG TPA: cupredoxin domain-containing protein [Candidatus Dormibacteraeota bacterium]|nr:cupredoxin domain-containing protein [Candidatus Dormibacteraeota bacterium]